MCTFTETLREAPMTKWFIVLGRAIHTTTMHVVKPFLPLFRLEFWKLTDVTDEFGGKTPLLHSRHVDNLQKQRSKGEAYRLQRADARGKEGVLGAERSAGARRKHVQTHPCARQRGIAPNTIVIVFHVVRVMLLAVLRSSTLLSRSMFHASRLG